MASECARNALLKRVIDNKDNAGNHYRNIKPCYADILKYVTRLFV